MDKHIIWQGKVVIGSVVAMSIWFVFDVSALSSLYIYVGYNVLISFLAATAAAMIIVRYRCRQDQKLSLENEKILPPLLFASIIYLGDAAKRLLTSTSPSMIKSDQSITIDIFEIFLFGVLLFLAVRFENTQIIKSRKKSKIVELSLLIGFLIAYWLFQNTLIPSLPEPLVLISSLVLGVSGICLYTVSALIVYRKRVHDKSQSHEIFSAAFLILVLSMISAILSIFINNLLWIVSFAQQGAAILIIMVGVTIPFLQEHGMSKRGSNVFTQGILTLTFTPFILALLVEKFLPSFYGVNLGAYSLSQFISAALALVLAFLVYRSIQRGITWGRYPLVIIFINWSLASLASIIIWNIIRGESGGESLIPFIVGSLVSFIALICSIKWTNSAPEYLKRTGFGPWVVFGTVSSALAIVLGEVIQASLEIAIPELIESTLGDIILLAFTLATMIVYIIALANLFSNNEGRISLDAAAVGFVAIWIFPNILKGVFPDWTAGWWAGEILRLVGLTFGLGLLGVLYLNTLARTRELQAQTVLYQDILAHDITNYLQGLTSAIDLAELEQMSIAERNLALSKARENIDSLSDLVRNVRTIGMAESSQLVELSATDVVDSITRSFNQVCEAINCTECQLDVNKAVGECFVEANAFLDDVFLNLIRNAIQYSKKVKKIDIQLIRKSSKWEIRVSDFGRGIDPSRKEHLFKRYSSGAEGSGLGLSVVKSLVEMYGGCIQVKDRVPGDYTQGATFVLILPGIDIRNQMNSEK